MKFEVFMKPTSMIKNMIKKNFQQKVDLSNKIVESSYLACNDLIIIIQIFPSQCKI